MKTRLLLLIFLLNSCSVIYAQTNRIRGFEDLMSALNSGEKVRIVVHYYFCKRIPGKDEQLPVPDAITGMEIDTYEYFAPGTVNNITAFVVFSDSKLIKNPIGKGFVYNYGKVRINEDNSVVVSARYIHPKSFKILMDESFTGKINDGNNEEGISLFINN